MKASDVPLKQGGVYGATTYFVSFVFAATVFYLDHLGTQLQYADSTTTESVALITTIFHNSMFIGSQLGGGEGKFTELPLCFKLRCLEFFGTDQGMLFTPAYYAIPPIALLGMGALVAYVTEPRDRLTAVLSGASLAVGFVVAMLAIILVFRFGVGFEIDPIMAVVAGIAYPVVFGGIGGFVGNELVGATASSGTATS
jgi:hypothetical protein